MALKPKPPGDKILHAFNLGLNETPDFGGQFQPNNSYHLPAYSVGLRDLDSLADANSIDSIAKEVAWQCLAVSTIAPTEQAVIGEVTPLHKAPRPSGHVFDGEVRMTSLSHGPMINGAYQTALKLSEQQRQQELIEKYNLKGDFEPRMLRLPGLLITAIWLKSLANGGQDWILPLHTKLPDLQKQNEEMYTMKEFLGIVKRRAQERLNSRVFD